MASMGLKPSTGFQLKITTNGLEIISDILSCFHMNEISYVFINFIREPREPICLSIVCYYANKLKIQHNVCCYPCANAGILPLYCMCISMHKSKSTGKWLRKFKIWYVCVYNVPIKCAIFQINMALKVCNFLEDYDNKSLVYLEVAHHLQMASKRDVLLWCIRILT
jgi:hypothetical protein